MTGRDRRDMDAAFLHEIANHPHDETAVLVYADWLCEQDDLPTVARGEFLRLESTLKHGRPGAQRGDFEWQARSLWWEYIEEWIGPLYDAVDHFRYERGLLSVEVSDRTLGQTDLDDLTAAPAWDWVQHIGVRRGGLGTLALLSELSRPMFLASIDVGRKAIDDVEEDMPSLLALPLLRGLKALDLSENPVGGAGCEQLASWADVSYLRKLRLRQAQLDDVALRRLLASPHLGSLEELDVSQNYIGTPGVRELCKAGVLPGLRRLDMRYNAVDWHDIAELQKRFGDTVDAYPARQHHPAQNW